MEAGVCEGHQGGDGDLDFILWGEASVWVWFSLVTHKRARAKTDDVK